jgi:hypothetical protein
MPRRQKYARIAITIPERDLAAADRLAKQLDRPRSWVLAEAVRRLAKSWGSASGATAGNSPVSREDPEPLTFAPGLSESRQAQLGSVRLSL